MSYDEALAQIGAGHAVRRRSWSTLFCLVLVKPDHFEVHTCKPSTWCLPVTATIEPFVGRLHRGARNIEVFQPTSHDRTARDWERLAFEKDRRP
jgi:hypothetical protein